MNGVIVIRKKVDVYNNLERLEYIRKTHFSNKKTLGKNPVHIENQSQKVTQKMHVL